MERTQVKTKEQAQQYAWERKQQEMGEIKSDAEMMRSEDIPEEEKEEKRESREPLSIDKREVLHIQLSTGGDGDGFRLEFMKGECIRSVYYWEDWGQYEEVALTEEETDRVIDWYLMGNPSAFLN